MLDRFRVICILEIILLADTFLTVFTETVLAVMRKRLSGMDLLLMILVVLVWLARRRVVRPVGLDDEVMIP